MQVVALCGFASLKHSTLLDKITGMSIIISEFQKRLKKPLMIFLFVCLPSKIINILKIT